MWPDIHRDFTWWLLIHYWRLVTYLLTNDCGGSSGVYSWLVILVFCIIRTKSKSMWILRWRYRISIWPYIGRVWSIYSGYWRSATWNLCDWHNSRDRHRVLHNNFHNWFRKSLHCFTNRDHIPNAFWRLHALSKRLEVLTRVVNWSTGIDTYPSGLWGHGCLLLVPSRRRAWFRFVFNWVRHPLKYIQCAVFTRWVKSLAVWDHLQCPVWGRCTNKCYFPGILWDWYRWQMWWTSGYLCTNLTEPRIHSNRRHRKIQNLSFHARSCLVLNHLHLLRLRIEFEWWGIEHRITHKFRVCYGSKKILVLLWLWS